MKYFLIIIAIFALLTSCDKSDGPVPSDETRITGSLMSFPSFEVSITEDDIYDMNYEYKVLVTATVDSTGNFVFQFPLTEPKVVQFRIGNQILIQNLYVYPGDDLKLKIDNRSPESLTIKYEGKSAKANEFHENIKKFFPKDQEFENQLYNPDLNAFLEWNDNRRKDMLDYYNDYFVKDTVPTMVNVNEISDINFQWAYLKNEWALRNYYYYQEAWTSKVIPDNYWDFLKDINFNEPFLHNFVDRYLESLVWQWHINQVMSGKTPTTQEMEFVRYEHAKNKFTNESRDIAMAMCINGLLAYQFDERVVELVSSLLNKFKNDVNNKNYIKPLEEKFKKRMSLLKGNPARDFSLPNIFKAPIALSDFKGKVVYLYFWSTMNPASPDVIPHFNNLQMQFAGDTNIVFLSLSLENNSWDKWKAFVDDNRALGAQIYVEGSFSNKVAKDYMINALPVYVLIDKKGKIYTMTAPYPGDEKLPDLLKSLF